MSYLLTLDVGSLHRLQSKKKCIQETLVSTTFTPQRKAVVPSKEVILALEEGAAAIGVDSRLREAIDAFILGLVRFQVGCCARFNDLQHTSPLTLKVTSNTVELMPWQTQRASAFRIKQHPILLIAPKLSLSGQIGGRTGSVLFRASQQLNDLQIRTTSSQL